MHANPLALIALLAGPAFAEPPSVVDISADVVQGLSGIEVSGDGARFLAVSDAGWFHRGRLDREDGVLTGGAVEEVVPIIGQDGFPVRARRVGDWSDAEGLALAEDGTAYVAFERWMRVARHPTTRHAAEWIRDHPEFRMYEDNRQLEAVAIDRGGTVHAFPEAEGPGGGFPVYRLDPEGWTVAGRIAASGGYLPVGADFAPDGRLYLLERRLVFATWFGARIRRFETGDWAGETIWESDLDAYGNLEGLSLWQAPDGLRALMVEDNNGRPGVPTRLVELRLTD